MPQILAMLAIYLQGNTAALPGILFYVILGAGVGEETLFRGYFQPPHGANSRRSQPRMGDSKACALNRRTGEREKTGISG